MAKYSWPSWWDNKPHPDVPFPHFDVLLGDYPASPQDVIDRALEEYAARHHSI